MTASRVDYKQRYQEKWPTSNKRERLVLGYLEDYLPPDFTPRLVGLGAGQSTRIEYWHRGVEDAFDIAVLYKGGIAAYIDVTGVDSLETIKKHKCKGYCVASWKHYKARKYNILDIAWTAFVIDDEPRILWLPFSYLDHLLASPHAEVCRLYQDEKQVYCLPSRYWRKARRFFTWLLSVGRYKAMMNSAR